jgi:hypothetical protein
LKTKNAALLAVLVASLVFPTTGRAETNAVANGVGFTCPAAQITTAPAAGTTLSVISYVVPPSGFDPLTASSAELNCYNIPQQPSDPNGAAGWRTAMQHLRYWITPDPVDAGFFSETPNTQADSPTFSIHPDATLGGITAQGSTQWAGYIAYANQTIQGTYVGQNPSVTWHSAWATWTVTPNTNHSGAALLDWVGYGGGPVVGGPLVQAGSIACGVGYQCVSGNNPNQYTLWYENYPRESALLPSGDFALNVNDTIYAEVDNNSSTSSFFFLEDETSGQYLSFIESNEQTQTNTTVEWAFESTQAGLPFTVNPFFYAGAEGITGSEQWISQGVHSWNNLAIYIPGYAGTTGINTSNDGFHICPGGTGYKMQC